MRAVNVFATTSFLSTSLSGNAGNMRGAGPSTTLPPSFGANFESWQGQNRSCSSEIHSVTSQPLCVQIAEYATTPSAARALVSGLSLSGSSRTSSTRLRRDPLRSVLSAGSIAHAIVCITPTGTSSGASGVALASPTLTSRSPSFGRMESGVSWPKTFGARLSWIPKPIPAIKTARLPGHSES